MGLPEWETEMGRQTMCPYATESASLPTEEDIENLLREAVLYYKPRGEMSRNWIERGTRQQPISA